MDHPGRRGHYDGVLILTTEGKGKILPLLVELASLGNVRSETMQGSTDKEFDAILKTTCGASSLSLLNDPLGISTVLCFPFFV
jgi:hypothetical protein